MTDFIHEQPREQTAAPPEPMEHREEPELDEQSGRKRVYGYILLLFIVAFSLLLWSFLMNQRSNEEVLSELRGSASSLQSTLDRNIALEQRTDELQRENDALSEHIEALEAEKQALQKEKEQNERDKAEAALSVAAMDALLGMERALSEGNRSLGRAYAELLDAPAQRADGSKSDKALRDYLPTATDRSRVSGDREPSAAERYAVLLEQMETKN